MKRSEYRAKRAADYSTDPSGIPDQWLDHDCQAAEAAGVKWDPEEPELPRRVRLGYNCGIPEILPAGDGLWPNKTERERGYKEAVRRWNAWPELRAEILRVRPSVGAPAAMDRLLAILDGLP